MTLNEPLAIAYHLKDELNEIWEQDDQETATALLMDWITYAESTGIRMLQQYLCHPSNEIRFSRSSGRRRTSDRCH